MTKQKILIIEDESDILDNINILLESENYETLTAKNGLEGIQKAKQFAPDLIICDIMMPDADGYEVLREISKDEKTNFVPFIFLTAKVERSDLRKGMELGADDYIFKPFNSLELLQAIRTRLNKFQTIVARLSDKQDADKSSSGKKKMELNENIFISYHNSTIQIALKKIQCISAENQYTKIVLDDHRNYLIRKPLSEWEQILPEKYFIRIHRSTIINLQQISKIEKHPEGAYYVSLKNMQKEFEISRRYIKRIKKIL